MTGKIFGRWTVLDDFITTPKGEKKWHCRCSCGTERYVLERALKSGGSLSCGCLRKEEVKKANSHDLTGKIFGDLTVLEQVDAGNRNGGLWWRCRCTCGKICEYPATLLATGKRTHCGCKSVKTTTISDISGQRFGRLTALCPTEKRDAKGFVLWHCACDCGREVEISYNNLVYSNQRSCGCQKREHEQRLTSFLSHVDGTSLEALKSKKIPVDNTTGYKGVYLIKGKYVAKIVFQKQQYYLGTYENIADAAAARQEAEKAIFSTALPFYEKWQRRAEEDPQWAAEHPVQVRVKRDGCDHLYLEMQPNI